MPEPSTLALFALAAAVLVAVPGPNLVYILTRSLSEGRRAGLASVLGVETGTVLHVLAAALGLSALVASSAVLLDVVRYAGAAYLVYLGVRALRGPAAAAAALAPGTATGSAARAYRQGVVVQVLNPKVGLFFLALVPQFVDPRVGPVAVQVVVLGLVLGTIGVTISSLYALGGSALAARGRGRGGDTGRGRYVTGGIYIALGVAAALTGDRRAS